MRLPPLEADWTVELRDAESGAPSDTCPLMQPGSPITVDLDQPSSAPATVTVTAPAALTVGGCADCQPLPWLDEIVLTRSGQIEPHFVGPVVSWRADAAGTLTVTARDRTIWPYRARVLASTLAYDDAGGLVDVDAHDLFARLWADGEAQNPTRLRLERLAPAPFPIGPWAVGGEPLGAQIDQLSDLAVDWACVGLHVYYGAPELALPDLDPLDDASFEPSGLTVAVNGDPVATQITARGEADVAATWPPGPPVGGDYGYHWAETSAPPTATLAQAEDHARRLVAAHGAPFVTVEPGDAGLSRFCPVDPTELIPGRLVRLVANFHGSTVQQKSRVAGLTWRLEAGVRGGGHWALMERAVTPSWVDAGVRA